MAPPEVKRELVREPVNWKYEAVFSNQCKEGPRAVYTSTEHANDCLKQFVKNDREVRAVKPYYWGRGEVIQKIDAKECEKGEYPLLSDEAQGCADSKSAIFNESWGIEKQCARFLGFLPFCSLQVAKK